MALTLQIPKLCISDVIISQGLKYVGQNIGILAAKSTGEAAANILQDVNGITKRIGVRLIFPQKNGHLN